MSNEDPNQIKSFNFHEYVITANNQSVLLTHFPNPYVASDSVAFKTTRIVRVPRAYDNKLFDVQNSYPQFSEYFPGSEPGALIANDGQGLSSKSPLEKYLTVAQYETIVKGINSRLVTAYYPWTLRNIVGNVLGFFTFWLSDYLIKSQVEIELSRLEEYIFELNKGLTNVRIVSLQRSGYLSLDFEIPKPE